MKTSQILITEFKHRKQPNLRNPNPQTSPKETSLQSRKPNIREENPERTQRADELEPGTKSSRSCACLRVKPDPTRPANRISQSESKRDTLIRRAGSSSSGSGACSKLFRGNAAGGWKRGSVASRWGRACPRVTRYLAGYNVWPSQVRHGPVGEGEVRLTNH